MIPKVIYRTWYTKRVHRNVRKEHKKIIELNPNYSQIIYTDKEIDDFVKDTYEKDIFNSFISLKNIVAKADLSWVARMPDSLKILQKFLHLKFFQCLLDH